MIPVPVPMTSSDESSSGDSSDDENHGEEGSSHSMPVDGNSSQGSISVPGDDSDSEAESDAAGSDAAMHEDDSSDDGEEESEAAGSDAVGQEDDGGSSDDGEEESVSSETHLSTSAGAVRAQGGHDDAAEQERSDQRRRAALAERQKAVSQRKQAIEAAAHTRTHLQLDDDMNVTTATKEDPLVPSAPSSVPAFTKKVVTGWLDSDDEGEEEVDTQPVGANQASESGSDSDGGSDDGSDGESDASSLGLGLLVKDTAVVDEILGKPESSSSSSSSSNSSSDDGSAPGRAGLMDSDDEDDAASVRSIDVLNIRSEFKGTKGAKLAQMESKFGDDDRFKMDKRFLDDMSSDDEAETPQVASRAVARNVHDEDGDPAIRAEREAAMDILAGILENGTCCFLAQGGLAERVVCQLCVCSACYFLADIAPLLVHC